MHTFIFWIAKEETPESLSQNKSSKQKKKNYMNVHIELGYTNKL